MKSVRNLAVCAIACALCSAAPTRGVEPKDASTQDDPRADVVKKYFAAPASAQSDAVLAQPQAKLPQDRTDPKWIESMQRLVKDLTDDNVKLRREIMDLRDQKDFLGRQLDECNMLLLKERQNRGAFNVPPGALRVAPPAQGSGQVPPNWKPFEFNGATYYMIPLEQRDAQDVAPRQKFILTQPEAKK